MLWPNYKSGTLIAGHYFWILFLNTCLTFVFVKNTYLLFLLKYIRSESVFFVLGEWKISISRDGGPIEIFTYVTIIVFAQEMLKGVFIFLFSSSDFDCMVRTNYIGCKEHAGTARRFIMSPWRPIDRVKASKDRKLTRFPLLSWITKEFWQFICRAFIQHAQLHIVFVRVYVFADIIYPMRVSILSNSSN